MAAEPERIRQHRVDSLRARDVGYIVEIAVRVGVLVVDRRRQTTLQDRFDANDRFDRAAGADQVTGHALGRRHGWGMIAEYRPDGLRLGAVIVRCRRAMRIDVADVGRLEPRPAERCAHRPRRAFTTFARRGDVVGVGRRAVASDLGVDVRVEWTAGTLGLVVAPRQGPHRVERGKADARHGGLGAAGDHDLGIAAADHLGCLAERVAGRRARAGHGEVGAFGAGLDRDHASQHVRQHHRHDERSHPIGPARVQRDRRVDDGADAADAAADEYPDLLG